MKERINASIQKAEFKTKELLMACGYHLFAAAGGFVAAKTAVSGSLTPFGLSLIAGCPQTILPSAAIGAFLGYFLSGFTNGSFHNIAALLAILTIRVLVGGLKKIAGNGAFLCLICFLASFLTAAVSFREEATGLVLVLTESVLAAAGTYLLFRCFKIADRAFAGITPEELSLLFLGLCIPVMGLCGIGWNGVSFGHIIAFLTVFTAAKYGGVVSGAICGIALSFALLFAGEPVLLAAIYAWIGLLAGLFSPFGKYAQIIASFLLGGIALLQSGNGVLIAGASVEFILGGALFLALPRQVGISISKAFASFPKMVTFAGVKKSVSMRLDLASSALKDISTTIEQVAGELSKINAPDFGSVISRVEEDACAGCKLRLHCWESRREETVKVLLSVANAVKQGENATSEAAPPEFKGRCLRLSQVTDVARRHYSDYISRIAAESRIEEVRSVVSDQFNGISMMLTELSRDIQNDLKFDRALAEKSVAALKTIGIQAEECSCRIDQYGRAVIEMKIKKEPDLVLNKLQIMKMTSVACERDFGVPALHETGENLYLVLNEYPALRVDIGVDQRCASESGMCGDAYQYFLDNKGHFVMILSDGMGTGGRAAVDGAMASGLMNRLIKAGFGYDCSLKILNASMLFKSTDESLATVDVASVDLFTGKTDLYKAGAAPTFIRRAGRAGKAESASLPAGILRDIRFDKASVRCKTGDIIVLISDGALSDGTEWIKKELEGWEEGTAQALAEKLCESARRRCHDNRPDDITVMTAILKPAV